MGLPARELPATVLDYFAIVDPELAEFVLADAASLAASGHRPGFMKLEDVPTGFFALIRERAQRGQPTRTFASIASGKGSGRAWKNPDRDWEAYYRNLEMLYHLILNLHLGGTNIFRVAAPLVERLHETDIDVPASELKLPFSSLMLVWDDDVSFAAFHEGRPFGKVAPKGALSTILVDIPAADGERLLSATAHHRGRYLNGMIHRSMRYGEGSLKSMLSTTWPGDPVPVSGSSGQAFNRLVLNTLLYMSTPNARVSPKAKTFGRAAPLVKSQHAHRLVGEGLAPFRKSFGSDYQRSPTASGRQLSSRHIVRGHWKLQPYGYRQAARKLVWVEPYVRGPQLSELLNRPRLVR